MYVLDDDRAILAYPPPIDLDHDSEGGWFRFRHRCDRGPRGVIVCAPELTWGGHTVTVDDSGVITVDPSIVCPDCGDHGWVRAGKWVPA